MSSKEFAFLLKALMVEFRSSPCPNEDVAIFSNREKVTWPWGVASVALNTHSTIDLIGGEAIKFRLKF